MAFQSRRQHYDDTGEDEAGGFAFPTRESSDDLFDPLAAGRHQQQQASAGASFDSARGSGYSPRARGRGGYGSSNGSSRSFESRSGERGSQQRAPTSPSYSSSSSSPFSSGYVSQLSSHLYTPAGGSGGYGGGSGGYGGGSGGYGGGSGGGYSPRSPGTGGVGYGRGGCQQREQRSFGSGGGGSAGGWSSWSSQHQQQSPAHSGPAAKHRNRWRRAGLYLKRRDERSASGAPTALSVVSVGVDVQIVDLFARVSLRQTFRNADDMPAEVEFVLPVARHCVVSEFRAVVDDLQIVAEVQEQPAAGELVLLEDDTYLWKANVGTIPAGKTVEVHVSYVGELAMKGASVHFVLPALILPEASDPKKHEHIEQSSWRRKDGDWAPPASRSSFQSASYALRLNIALQMPSPIVAIVSPSHPTSLQRSFGSAERVRSTQLSLEPQPQQPSAAAVAAQSTPLTVAAAAADSNVELLVELAEPHAPHAWLERHPTLGTQAAAFVWYPDFGQLPLLPDGKTVLSDVSIDWGLGAAAIEQTPTKLRAIFVLGRVLVYALLSEPLQHAASVTLKAAAADGPRIVTAQLDPNQAVESGGLLHTLAARKMLRELERAPPGRDADAIRLSKWSGLASALCTVLAPRDEFFAVPDGASGSVSVALRPAGRPSAGVRYSEFARDRPQQAPMSPTSGGGHWRGNSSGSPRAPGSSSGGSSNFGWGAERSPSNSWRHTPAASQPPPSPSAKLTPTADGVAAAEQLQQLSLQPPAVVDRVASLCGLQRPDGSWALDASLANAIGMPLAELQKQCSRNEDGKFFATALAMTILERDHSDRMTDWWPAAQNGGGFLQTQFTFYDWQQKAADFLVATCK
eukprot:TRINITY_DN613_c0_g1_i1.p1 TRINITY_DN613_c0_g1~~TRINITY_DN613_c0_g1_i1.p1  ORF type:complete len:857 (+),score=295.64 TRINITY_DN613_c0_g1_i1:997-3567(+)